MKMKTLLLGSAAALGVVGAAQAADVAKPAAVVKPAPVVNYVQVCDLYGIGYFYLPGQKDTCLRIQGQVQFQLNFHTSSIVWRGSGTSSPHSAGWSTNLQGQVTVTAKRQTDHGDLIGVVRITSTSSNPNTAGAFCSATSSGGITTTCSANVPLDRYVQMDRGYIQLGSKFAVTVGYNSSVYGIGTTKQVSFAWDLGGGTQLQAGIDDPRDRWGSRLPSYFWMPDLVASLTGNYALGTWGLSGGVGQVAVPELGPPGPYGQPKLVWGVTAKTTINTPMIAKGDQLALTGIIGDGCQFVSCSGSKDTGQIIWQAAAGFKHVFNAKVNTNTQFLWNHTDFNPGGVGSFQVTTPSWWQLTSTTQYLPTTERNLQLQFQARVSGTVGSATRNWTAQIQDQYSF